ncbi:MAG: PEGA domain-containing protein, partial [Deltaproteobacteria bacterium]|nr:PEGA domain-containing protein [Deltaproteobacteria bacterium]
MITPLLDMPQIKRTAGKAPPQRNRPRRILRLGLPLAAAAMLSLILPQSTLAAGLAVFRIDPLGIDAHIVARLDGLLRIELARLADATIPDPSAVQLLVRKHPRLAACTGDVSCLAEAGRLLGVDRIISGNVGALGDSYVVNLKIVDVKTTHEISRIQETISGRPDELIDAVRVAAYRLVAPERLRGALTVLANIPKAKVWLDGALIGQTPLPLQHNLTVGEHSLRVAK